MTRDGRGQGQAQGSHRPRLLVSLRPPQPCRRRPCPGDDAMTTQDWLDYHFQGCRGMRKQKLQAALLAEADGDLAEAYRLHDESGFWREAQRDVDRLDDQWVGFLELLDWDALFADEGEVIR